MLRNAGNPRIPFGGRGDWMLRAAVWVCAAWLLSGAAVRADDPAPRKLHRRLDRAAMVLQELLESPDRGVPQALIRNCRCIAVFPGVVKAALGWGGRHGRGVVSCRGEDGTWSPPSFINISGGSVGLQIGVNKTELVLFIMGEKGARSLLESEFTLGGGASVAAGPLGRTAEGATDAKFDAEIYAYAKAKGLFAGIALEGARVNAADEAIQDYYGKPLTPEAILFRRQVPRIPSSARRFLEALPVR